MVANGAAGQTRGQFEQVLAPVDKLNNTALELTAALGELRGSTQLSVANSVWIAKGLPVRDAFLRTVVGIYHSQVFEADLTQSKDDINAWVKDKTRNMIPSILDEEPEADTAAILLNALYMKAKWLCPFRADDTRPMPFTREDGERIDVDMMTQTGEFPYFDADGARGALLPYDDGRLAMLVMRPTDGAVIGDFVQGITGERAQRWMDAAAPARLDLGLPKFSLEYGQSLNCILSDMGLGIAFDSYAADFSDLADADLFLSSVVQKVRIDVDEEGTEAAAVTAATVGLTSFQEPEPSIPLIFDTPFVYGIVDSQTGTVLFAGVYRQP